jgi:hypothetical protein
MQNRLGRAIEWLPSAEETKAAVVIEFCIGMTTIGREFVIFSHQSDILLNTASMLEAETEIICTVQIALLGCAMAILRRKRDIFVNANSAFQENTETVHWSGVFLLS